MQPLSKKLVLTSMLCVSTLVYAYAQNKSNGINGNTVATTSTTQAAQPTVVTTIVADTNVTDVFSKEAGGKITGGFALQGNMGKQNDIVYGIIVVDSEGRIIDGTTLGTQPSIQEGEVIRKNFLYTIPTYLSGKGLAFILKAETVGGLPLGSSVLLKRDFPVKESTLSCSEKETVITCTSKVDTSLTIKYFKETLLGQVVSNETKEIKKGAKLVYINKISPGRYYIQIKNADMSAQALFSVSVKGSYGTISNTVITEKSKGLLSIVSTANVSPNIGAKIQATLTQGQVKCGEGSGELRGGTASFDVQSTCKDGQVVVSLIDKNGTTLDTKNSAFSVTRYVPETTSPSSPEKKGLLMNYVYASIAFLLLFVLWFIRREYKKSASASPTSQQ